MGLGSRGFEAKAPKAKAHPGWSHDDAQRRAELEKRAERDRGDAWQGTLVLVGGMARSGTTASTDMLGCHSDLAPLYETDFIAAIALQIQALGLAPLPKKAWCRSEPPPKALWIAGTWDDYEKHTMAWDGDAFVYHIRVSPEGRASFQLWLDETARFYPNTKDGNPMSTICGPDFDGLGHDKNWTIGWPRLHHWDLTKPIESFKIMVAVDCDGSPMRVTWKRDDSKGAREELQDHATRIAKQWCQTWCSESKYSHWTNDKDRHEEYHHGPQHFGTPSEFSALVLRHIPLFCADIANGREPLEALGSFVNTLFAFHAKRKRKKGVVNKSPQYAEIFPLWAQMCPNAKIIHMVRNPRDVTGSVLPKNYGPVTLEEAVQRGVSWAVAGREWGARNADRCTELRYEDLVSCPDRELSRLFRFCGVRDESKDILYKMDGFWHYKKPGRARLIKIDPARGGKLENEDVAKLAELELGAEWCEKLGYEENLSSAKSSTGDTQPAAGQLGTVGLVKQEEHHPLVATSSTMSTDASSDPADLAAAATNPSISTGASGHLADPAADATSPSTSTGASGRLEGSAAACTPADSNELALDKSRRHVPDTGGTDTSSSPASDIRTGVALTLADRSSTGGVDSAATSSRPISTGSVPTFADTGSTGSVRTAATGPTAGSDAAGGNASGSAPTFTDSGSIGTVGITAGGPAAGSSPAGSDASGATPSVADCCSAGDIGVVAGGPAASSTPAGDVSGSRDSGAGLTVADGGSVCGAGNTTARVPLDDDAVGPQESGTGPGVAVAISEQGQRSVESATSKLARGELLELECAKHGLAQGCRADYASCAAKPAARASKYFVCCSWNDWERGLEEMDQMDDGTFHLRVGTAIGPSGEFQIVRDKDWSTVFYPHDDSSQCCGGPARLGPDTDSNGKNWRLSGRIGDVISIYFEPRPYAEGAVAANLSWRLELQPEDQDGLECYIQGPYGKRLAVNPSAYDEGDWIYDDRLPSGGYWREGQNPLCMSDKTGNQEEVWSVVAKGNNKYQFRSCKGNYLTTFDSGEHSLHLKRSAATETDRTNLESLLESRQEWTLTPANCSKFYFESAHGTYLASLHDDPDQSLYMSPNRKGNEQWRIIRRRP